MMVIDASAMVVMLTGEPEAEAFADRVEASRAVITSPIAIFEAVLAIKRKHQCSLPDARASLQAFLKTAGITLVPITEKEADLALDAFDRYGRGTGHSARLNMGDCFSYALARSRDMPLLFKGDDFSRTDIADAALTL